MILKNKIKKIIDVITDTEITEVVVSSFWGAQKIKLKKGKDFDIKSNLKSLPTKSYESEHIVDNVSNNIPKNNPISEPIEEFVEVL